MRRLVLVALLLTVPTWAFAQEKVIPYVGNAPWSASNPAPVTGTTTISGTVVLSPTILTTTISGTVAVSPTTLPPGASTAANQAIVISDITASQTPVAPATATATKGNLVGCQYTSAGISPTDGQQMGIQCDQYGRINAVGGTANQVVSTPTISTAAYAAGNCIGGFNSIVVTSYNGQSAFLTNFRISSISGAAYQIIAYIFDSQPTTSVCTDKGAFSLSAADVDKIIGTVPSSTLAVLASTFTSPTVAIVDYTPPRPFRAGGSSSSGVNTIYYSMALAAAITPSTVSDLHLRFGILRD